MATSHPWAAHLFAAATLAMPAPITIKSKCWLIGCSSSRWHRC